MIYPWLSTGIGMVVFFTNVFFTSLREFLVRYLTLFLLFSVIGGFSWFWMRSLHKNIQLMLEFLKVPVLVLRFSYYTLMTFLMMVSIILLFYVHMAGLITLVLLIWKWIGLFLSKNHLLRCWGFHSFLNWVAALVLSLLLKLPPRKLEP